MPGSSSLFFPVWCLHSPIRITELISDECTIIAGADRCLSERAGQAVPWMEGVPSLIATRVSRRDVTPDLSLAVASDVGRQGKLHADVIRPLRLRGGERGGLMVASTLHPAHFPSAVSGEQAISSPILVFLCPALCYFHQMPTKYPSRRVHLNGVHLSYLEPLACRRLPSHNIKPDLGNITFTTRSSELSISDFFMWGF